MSLSASNLTYEYHDKLEPSLWASGKIKLEIKDKLLEIAEAFLEYIGIDVDVEDIVLTGSLANYNYTKYSDLDMHIITDLDSYKYEPDLIKAYFNAKKTIWNSTRHILIKNYDVELYVQDTKEVHNSTGVYSLKTDQWIVEPHPIKNIEDIDTDQVKKKLQSMADMIDYALSPECTIENAEAIKDKIIELRKAGLEKVGESSPENLAFKELRRAGEIERLVKGTVAKKDKKLSLQEVKAFKSFANVGIKRGPRHRSLTAGIGKLMNPEVKSIGMVAQMHKVDELPAIHNLKKMGKGYIVLPQSTAMTIATDYSLDWASISRGQERGLSTSGIMLGYNPRANVFYLRK